MTELEEIIQSEIQAGGAISFARFMELALYHPDYGYYERHLKQTGREGDFFTSVSVGSIYGEFLGLEFADRLAELGAGGCMLIEAGAHDGQLARDLLNYLGEYQKEIFRAIEYLIIEPSPTRAARQAQMLDRFAGKVRWVRDWNEIGEFRGICFSNELLDAMPVHVFRWNSAAGDWTEWGITRGTGQCGFQWQPLPVQAQNIQARRLLGRISTELMAVLPNDFTVEISPESVSWWMRAAHSLVDGWLFTVDYGLLQDDFFQPHRSRGTLRAYSKHRMKTTLLESAGEQDITAHVNFSLLIAAAEGAGLVTEQFIHQGMYLKTILEKVEQRPEKFPLWTPMRYRQLIALVNPEHLGRAFKVLIQRRSGEPLQ